MYYNFKLQSQVQCNYGSFNNTLCKSLTAGLIGDSSVVARWPLDLFYTHSIFMPPQHFEAIDLDPCAKCLADNASEDDIEHFQSKH